MLLIENSTDFAVVDSDLYTFNHVIRVNNASHGLIARNQLAGGQVCRSGRAAFALPCVDASKVDVAKPRGVLHEPHTHTHTHTHTHNAGAGAGERRAPDL